jgi:hypothetical protein
MTAAQQELEREIQTLARTIGASQFNNSIAATMRYAYMLGKTDGYIEGVQFATRSENNDEP